ncbi:tetratricopeptide repeat protein [Butyrivibrio sp. FC2001]|uniref:tetratricopeptide repeat protein n=1 Tax=Butyrivibrio sp. FC2001 TaxID=1280671 RepID=UPI00041BECEA|nr:hypothetical protein [Butyrivibrio sp. FC2001]
MDKTEYKIRAEEIKSLIRAQRFADAVKIADTIDWKRVKSVGMLCAISDLYKVNRRLEESRDILLLAYDRSPTRREIVYSLCELAIAMGEFVQAVEYYKEFVRLAPRNTARYILQYKLYEAQEVSLEERIAVLEEYKKHDYNEKWAYELAYLYHRVGLTTECIEECDELFLYMREGRYVIKALELKALHEPLSAEQKAVYAKYKAEISGNLYAPEVQDSVPGKDVVDGKKAPTRELPELTEEQINGQPYYQNNAVNEPVYQAPVYEAPVYEQPIAQAPVQEAPMQEIPLRQEAYEAPQAVQEPYQQEIPEPYTVPTVNVDTYNTVDLQKEIAENLKEVLISNPEAALFADAHGPQVIKEGDETESLDTGDMFDTTGDITGPSMSELFYEDKKEDVAEKEPVNVPIEEKEPEQESLEVPTPEDDDNFTVTKIWSADEVKKASEPAAPAENKKAPISEELKDKEIAANIAAATMNDHTMYKGVVFMDEPLQDEVPGAVIRPNVRYQINSNSHFDKMLSQETDGQISIAIDDAKQVERQITGQISINEFMSDWENYKKQQQEKQYKNVKKLMASETGELFKDFDENLKDALLGEAGVSGIKEEVAKEPVIQEEEIIPEPVQETAKTSDTLAVEETSQEITPVDDLQNTQSIVLITGENLEEATNTEKAPEEDNGEEKVAAEVDLGETTEIKSEEVEEAIAKASGMKELKVEEAPKEEVQEELPEEELPQEEESEEVPSEEISEEEIPEDEIPEEAPEEKAEDIEEEKTEEPVKPVKEEKVSRKQESEDADDSDDDTEDAGLEQRVRVMTPEEKGLFGPYIHYKKSRKQIIRAIDNLSMAAYTNNAIVTGEEGAGTVNLAKGLIKAVQSTDSNFSGKVAMITAMKLNKSSVSSILDKIVNGALIIRRAADLKEDTVKTLLKQLQSENKGYIVVIEDTKDDIDRLLDKYPDLNKCFNVRVDIEALDDDSLVAYAEQYALEKEHIIDNLGILALHQKISERQTLDHEVTVAEVKEMVDDAIYYADKHSIGHYFDVLLRKRYDKEDMIILREKDFLH